jgi:hypothetical protein
MAIPFKISTMGNQNTRNVLKIVFSEALALPPKIEAWDNSQEFPARDSYGATTSKQIFSGTTGNGNIPMLYAVATTSSAPGAEWKPTSATAGGAVKNRLKGTTNYVIDPTTPRAGEYILVNIGLEVPYDSALTAGAMDHIIQTRYFFSGAIPTVTFYGNSGTESAPSWTRITPPTHGMQFCDLSVEGNYYLTLPEEGVSDAQVIWVTSRETYDETFSCNANLKSTEAGTMSADSKILKTISSSMKGDAYLDLKIPFTGDACLRLTHFHGDARLL